MPAQGAFKELAVTVNGLQYTANCQLKTLAFRIPFHLKIFKNEKDCNFNLFRFPTHRFVT